MSSNSFEQFIAEKRRRFILVALQSTVQFSASARLIRSFCASQGFDASLETIGLDLTHLHKHGLVDLTNVGGQSVPKLLPKGDDVARGRTSVSGVAAPEPGEV